MVEIKIDPKIKAAVMKNHGLPPKVEDLTIARIWASLPAEVRAEYLNSTPVVRKLIAGD